MGPNGVKYMPLFQKGERVVDQSRQLYRRAITRRRILRELASKPNTSSWIPQDQYKRLPNNWSIQDEEKVFGGSISRKRTKGKKTMHTDDSRFALASQHEALLQAADQIEIELKKEEDERQDSDSVDSDDMEDNKLRPKKVSNTKIEKAKVD